MNLVSKRRIFNQRFQHLKLHPIDIGAKLLITYYNFLCLINTPLKEEKRKRIHQENWALLTWVSTSILEQLFIATLVKGFHYKQLLHLLVFVLLWFGQHNHQNVKIALEISFCLRDSWWLETFRCGVITDMHNQLRVVEVMLEESLCFGVGD